MHLWFYARSSGLPFGFIVTQDEILPVHVKCSDFRRTRIREEYVPCYDPESWPRADL